MSPLLVWEGPEDEMPNFCPQGCGGVTGDPYGGPCQACWDAVDEREGEAAGKRESGPAAVREAPGRATGRGED